MDQFVKQKENGQVPFMMQSNTLVPPSGALLSPKQKDEKTNKSIITLENADL